jgi:hypothetical protein
MLLLQRIQQQFHKVARGGIYFAGAPLQAPILTILPPILFDYEVEGDTGDQLNVFFRAAIDIKFTLFCEGTTLLFQPILKRLLNLVRFLYFPLFLKELLTRLFHEQFGELGRVFRLRDILEELILRGQVHYDVSELAEIPNHDALHVCRLRFYKAKPFDFPPQIHEFF